MTNPVTPLSFYTVLDDFGNEGTAPGPFIALNALVSDQDGLPASSEVLASSTNESARDGAGQGASVVTGFSSANATITAARTLVGDDRGASKSADIVVAAEGSSIGKPQYGTGAASARDFGTHVFVADLAAAAGVHRLSGDGLGAPSLDVASMAASESMSQSLANVPVARWSTPFRVTPAGYNIASGSVSISAIGGPNAGEFVAVWSAGGDPDDLGDASGSAIYGQLYNEDGTPRGDVFLINSTTAGEQIAPIVVPRGAEPGFAVIFQDQSGANGSGTDVRIRLFDENGVAEGNDVVVASGGTTIGNAQIMQSAALGRDFGTIFIAYNDANEIRAQLFGSGAPTTPVAADFEVTTGPPPPGEADIHSQSNVAAIPNLGFIATWVDNPDSGVLFAGGTAIRGQLYSYLGAPSGTQFTVATGTSNTLVGTPKAAALTTVDNRILVTWVQDDDAGAGNALDYNVYGRIYTTDGLSMTPVAGPFLVSETATNNQTQQVVAAYDDERFVVVWTDSVPFGTPEIRARIFNNDGTASSAEFAVIPEDTGSQNFAGQLASVTVLFDTINSHPIPRFVVTWNDNAGGGWAQIFSPAASELLGYDWFGSENGEVYTAQYGERILIGNGGNDTLTGKGTDDQLYGAADVDTLYGLGGNDTLDGGTGADFLYGGLNNDTYYVDSLGDQVVETAGEGDDRVFARATYVLAAGQSIELLATASQAGTTAINLTGNNIGQRLNGNAGNNVLDGGGGIDQLYGFAGNDTFYVNHVSDQVFEATGQGTDTVYARVSYVLAAGQSVEVLGTSQQAGTAAINLTGNEITQTVRGNAGNNVLDGGGGGDQLYGLAGNDTFYINNAADQVFEVAGQGTDQIFARVSYVLNAGQAVELLATSQQAGTAAINLTGNEIGQTVRGNAGNNVLDGGGGIDQLYGLAGNDTYYVNLMSDQVFEVTGQGTDTVYARTSYTLAAGQSIEVFGTSQQAGTVAINLVGNEIGQTIRGNAGINTIYGLGGTDIIYGGRGNDTLVGGLGLDTFVFDTTLSSANNVDTIADFNIASDSIHLENAIFTALTATGPLAASAFHIGTAAADAADRIVYNSANGWLSYDADGSGAGGASHFATLSTGLALTAGHFVVI